MLKQNSFILFDKIESIIMIHQKGQGPQSWKDGRELLIPVANVAQQTFADKCHKVLAGKSIR